LEISAQNVIQYTWYDRARENAEEYGHLNIIQWWHENIRQTTVASTDPMGMDQLLSYGNHIIICHPHTHCRRTTVLIETIIMDQSNVVALGDNQAQYSSRVERTTIVTTVAAMGTVITS
jgi:hypothetical protein